MRFDDYKIVLYRQENDAWVAEILSLSGCYALMDTREQALAELRNVFAMIEEEYREKGLHLPADSTDLPCVALRSWASVVHHYSGGLYSFAGVLSLCRITPL